MYAEVKKLVRPYFKANSELVSDAIAHPYTRESEWASNDGTVKGVDVSVSGRPERPRSSLRELRQLRKKTGYHVTRGVYVDYEEHGSEESDLFSDEEIPEEFPSKVEYGVWLAGQNMIRINSRNKRKLHAYDEFMILLETKDSATVKMHNILQSAGFTPKRNANTNNAFSQIKSGQAIFAMKDDYGKEGRYFKRALTFHKRTWDLAPAELEVWRPMALLYAEAENEGFTLDEEFDVELGKLFIKLYGDPNTTQQSLKDTYHNQLHTKGFREPRDHDQWRVYDAIINLYNKHVKRIQLPTAQCRW
jgi:hypothetical protein